RRGALLACALAIAALVWPPLRPAWPADVFAVIGLALPAVVWATLPAAFSGSSLEVAGFGFYAVVTLLQLYPAADFLHALMSLPIFVVLLVRLLHARTPASVAGRVAGVAIAVAFAAAFVQPLVMARLEAAEPGVR